MLSPDRSIEELKKDLIKQIRPIRDEDGQSHQQWQDFINSINLNTYIQHITTVKGDTECRFVRCIMQNIPANRGNYQLRKNLLNTLNELVGKVLRKYNHRLRLFGYHSLVSTLQYQCGKCLDSITINMDALSSSNDDDDSSPLLTISL